MTKTANDLEQRLLRSQKPYTGATTADIPTANRCSARIYEAVTRGAFKGLSSRAMGEQISSSTAKAVSQIVDTPNFPREGIYFGLGSAGNEDFITISEIKLEFVSWALLCIRPGRP